MNLRLFFKSRMGASNEQCCPHSKEHNNHPHPGQCLRLSSNWQGILLSLWSLTVKQQLELALEKLGNELAPLPKCQALFSAPGVIQMSPTKSRGSSTKGTMADNTNQCPLPEEYTGDLFPASNSFCSTDREFRKSKRTQKSSEVNVPLPTPLLKACRFSKRTAHQCVVIVATLMHAADVLQNSRNTAIYQQ